MQSARELETMQPVGGAQPKVLVRRAAFVDDEEDEEAHLCVKSGGHVMRTRHHEDTSSGQVNQDSHQDTSSGLVSEGHVIRTRHQEDTEKQPEG